MKQKLLLLSIFLLSGLIAFGQGITTSSMNGRITDDTGKPLPGATVVAVHTPTGTQFGNVSNNEGYYRMANMNVGGPYTITVSFVGFQEFKKENVYLTLGQSLKLDVQMKEQVTELQNVEIVANRNDIFDGNRTGQETIVGEDGIQSAPTVSRSIADYARLNPLASIGENADGFTVSLAGQNNRFNTIFIDGAVNNDVFGLAGSGTNGGQTGVQPISIDAIEQFQVSIAPFDVRQSGFAGGSINAVTRSGTNSVEGSAYYFMRNQKLAGETPTDDPNATRSKLADFSAQTYGFRVGGPIIKDKLFFFLNGEQQRDKTPQPFDFSNYDGNASLSDLTALANFMQTKYGYDIGTFDNNERFLNSDKVLAKLDWNINQKNKLSLRHSYVHAENLEARRSSPRSLGFLNGSEYFISNTNSSALELRTALSNTMANKLTLGATIVRDDRDPYGDPFPTLLIDDGDGGIEIGAERFSTANLLNQDILTLNEELEMFKGKHSFLAGVNMEYYNVGNLFIRENYGSYSFFDASNWASGGQTGLQKFLDPANQDANGNPISSRISRSWSQVDMNVGDASSAIAAFKQILMGFYIQDQIQVSDQMKITAGLRVDLPIYLDEAPVNDDFNMNTIPKLEANGYDLEGAHLGSNTGLYAFEPIIKTKPALAPRIGFNYDVSGDQVTQIRGGIGFFTSRIPLVWPGGAFNNYGYNIGGGTKSNQPFNPDVNSQWQNSIDPPTASGQIDLFAKDFRLPRVLKIDVAVDRKLPGGIIGTVEGIYSKFVNYIRYQNINLLPSTTRLTGSPDNRPIWNFGRIESKYTGIYLASNTNNGYSYNVALTLTKPFDNGLNTAVSYSYGDSYTVNDGTSSQNNSQWRGYFDVDGKNNDGPAQRSTFAAGHRVLAQISYKKDYLKFLGTEISLVYNGQSGQPYTYVVGARNSNFVNDGGFDNNELFYVPKSQNEINLVSTSTVTASPAEQWASLDDFIKNDPYLKDRRGKYTQRNSNFLPFESIIDLRFLQDFYITMGNGKKNTLQFSLDIFNFTNLLNKDWGRRRGFSFGTYPIVSMVGFEADGTTPKYAVNSEIVDGDKIYTNDIIDSGFRSSRWQMQLGLRYIFQ